MSGGSHDYTYLRVQEFYEGGMHDAELNDLIKDLVEVLHDLEWMESGDIGEKGYAETVEKFKKKWFIMDRNERLKGYIDKSINECQRKLYSLIGVKDEPTKPEPTTIGEWGEEFEYNGKKYHKCSSCHLGIAVDIQHPFYCPNCGSYNFKKEGE